MFAVLLFGAPPALVFTAVPVAAAVFAVPLFLLAPDKNLFFSEPYESVFELEASAGFEAVLLLLHCPPTAPPLFEGILPTGV